MNKSKLFEQLKRKRFLSIGRAGMDFYAEPPGTEFEQANNFSAHVGGSAGNIAVALVKLGCEVELVTCFSDDAVGRFTVNKLHEFGVGTSHCRIVGGEARNTLAVIETRLKDCQSVIYRNGAADFEMNSKDVKKLDYEGFGGVIISGTALADEPSRSAIYEAIEHAHAANSPIIIDMDYRPYSWKSADEAKLVYSSAIIQCDIVLGNDVEFGVAAGNYKEGLNYAKQLVTETPEVVIYKKGEFGSLTLTKDESFEKGVFSVQAIKPTGAGDSFMGGFIAGLANCMTLEDSVVQGSASAALVVTRVACSTAMPFQVELSEFLKINTISKIRKGD